MANLNRLQIIGRVGKTPEARYTPGGKKVVALSVAVNNKFTTAGGEKREETEWFNLEVWGGSADFVQQYVGQGDSVFVEGRVKTERFEGKDGGQRTSVKVVVSNFQLLESKNGSSGAPVSQQAEVEAPDDDSIPF